MVARIVLRWIGVAGILATTAACGTLSRGNAAPPPVPSPSTVSAPSSPADSAGTPSSTGGPSAKPSPSTATTASPAALRLGPSAPGPWKQVFGDDFNGPELNGNTWATCYDWNDNGCTNSGNHESQWYTPGQVSQSGGALLLSASRRWTQGSNGRDYPWTSGMVSTGRDHWSGPTRATFTYGYFAAAIRIPPQQGMFPSFWLMPSSRVTPPEIDVMEGIKSTTAMEMNVHWADAEGADKHASKTYGPVDYPAGYHVFAVDWEPKSITWYIDGVARYRVTDTAHIPDVPMELLLDLAVGYPQAPPASVDSARMSVDWVRVWQH